MQQAWYLHEQVPPPLGPVPQRTVLAAACLSASANAPVLPINPADWGDAVQPGDLVMISAVLGGAAAPTDSPCLRFNDPIAAVDQGWMLVHGMCYPGSGEASELCAAACWARLAQAGDTTAQYQLRLVNSGTSGTGCYEVRAYRGVSQVRPIDYVMREPRLSYELGACTGALFLPASRCAGARGRFVTHMVQSATASLVTYSPAAAHYLTPGHVRSLDAVSRLQPAPPTIAAATNHLTIIDTVAVRGALYNLVGGYDNDTNGDPLESWGRVGTSVTAVTTGGQYITRHIEVEGNGSTTLQYYIERSWQLAAGRRYYVALLLGGQYALSSSNLWYVSMTGPDGTKASMLASQSGGSHEWVTLSGQVAVFPPIYYSYGDGYGGLPDRVIGHYGFGFDSGPGGLHNLRMNVISNSRFAFVSGTSNRQSMVLMGLAVGDQDTGPPSLRSTDAADPFLEDAIASGVFYVRSVLPTRPAASNPTPLLQCQIVSEQVTTWPRARMWIDVMTQRRVRFDSNVVAVGGRLQTGDFLPSDNVQGASRYQLCVDRPAPPRYRLDANAPWARGKYYLECEIKSLANSGSVAAASFTVGLVPATHRVIYLNNRANDGPFAFAIAGPGQVFHGAGSAGAAVVLASLTAERLGFAFDLSAMQASLYRDGSLAYSGSLAKDSSTYLVATYWTVAVRQPVGEDGDSSYATWSLNLTGPFVYTMPSGYVAFDYMNEVP